MVILYEYNSTKEFSTHQITENYKEDQKGHKKRSNDTSDMSQSTNSQQTTSVLCPAYEISRKKHGHLECFASFVSTACDSVVNVYLEVWITESRLLQSTARKAFIDCNDSPPLYTR